MGKSTGTVVALAVVAVGVLAYNQTLKRATTQLHYRTVRIRAGRLRFEGNRLIVPLIVSNPNSEDITVRSVVGEAWFNGNKVGNVEMFDTVVVKANKKTTIDLNVRLMALNIVDAILDMYNEKGAGNVEIGFTGTVNVDNKPMPIQMRYKVL